MMNPITRLLIAFSLILSACGVLPATTALTPTPTTAEPSPASTRTPTAEVTPTQPPLDPGSLVLWVPPFLSPSSAAPAGELLNERLQAFESEHPELTLQIRIKAASGPGGLLDMLSAAGEAGPNILPDIIALDSSSMYAAALKGLIRSLEGSASPPEEPEWYSFASGSARIDGELFGYPFASDAWIMMYRTASYSTQPRSWNGLLEGTGQFLFPANDSNALFSLAQYRSLGGSWSDSSGHLALDSDTLLDVFLFYRSGLEEDVISLQCLDYQSAEGTWNALLEGKAAAAVVPLNRFLLQETTIGFSALPLPTQNGTGFGLAQPWSWAMVTSDPLRQERGLELLEWLLAPEFLGPWTNALGMLPPTASALALWPEGNKSAVANQVVGALREPPPEEILGIFGPPIHSTLAKFFEGSISASTAVEEISLAVENP